MLDQYDHGSDPDNSLGVRSREKESRLRGRDIGSHPGASHEQSVARCVQWQRASRRAQLDAAIRGWYGVEGFPSPYSVLRPERLMEHGSQPG